MNNDSLHGFERIQKQHITEYNTSAELFKHKQTGAEVLVLENDDPTKAFSITFPTPPFDSSGAFHILEHSIFCGSRKYPVKCPFVEILKGSLQTFINAYTYIDFTTFVGSSQNHQDFHNLMGILLDSVFHPLITPDTFQTEGWRYELNERTGTLEQKGIVMSEMKGYYLSQEAHREESTRQALFPNSPYRFDPGGEPGTIPKLSYEVLKECHSRYYHPCNARIYLYGDVDLAEDLRIINDCLKDTKTAGIKNEPYALQQPFDTPIRVTRNFPIEASKKDPGNTVTVNWMLDGWSPVTPAEAGAPCPGEENDWGRVIAFYILQFILTQMPGAPLRKALMDSGYGSSLAGNGLNSDLRQFYFATGLKGAAPEDTDKIETLILDTLTNLCREGIPREALDAAVNNFEFSMREQTSKPFPHGVQLMLRTMTQWLFADAPFKSLSFQKPLDYIKTKIANKEPYFEQLIQRYFLENKHRATLIMEPERGLTERNEKAEKERLEKIRAALNKKEIESIKTDTAKLNEIQDAPNTPEALATIPLLKIADLPRTNKAHTAEVTKFKGTQVLYHDIFTNGILYLTIGFNLHVLPMKYLSYARLLVRGLLELGTDKNDYVNFTRRINLLTGGISPGFFNSSIKNSRQSASWCFLQGKAMVPQTADLLDILKETLLFPREIEKKRFTQILAGEINRQERKLLFSGHRCVQVRLAAHFSEAGRAGEQINGIDYLLTLRRLAGEIKNDWPAVNKKLEEIRSLLVNRNAILINATLEAEDREKVETEINRFLDTLPAQPTITRQWLPAPLPHREGLLLPGQVNAVGKAVNLYENNYNFHGSAFAISRYLESTWLWEELRVRRGAYQGHCYFDRLSGAFSAVTDKDPNILSTLQVYDETAAFLKNMDFSREELDKSIIGAIADIDKHKPPDMHGYTAMMRFLAGVTPQDRLQVREEILSTAPRHFKEFGEALESLAESPIIKIMASQNAIAEAMPDQSELIEVF
ncbi:MAG: peptidase M16 [bacterium]|nr:peptidase M16 [bacterium]